MITEIIAEGSLTPNQLVKSEFIDALSKHEQFSITIDEWTSVTNQRFMGIVLIMTGTTFNIGMSPITGAASPENLLSTIKGKLAGYNLSLDSCVSIMSSGAAVMKQIQRSSNVFGQLCLNNGVCLAVKDSIARNSRNSVDYDDLEEDSEVESLLNEEYREALKKMKKVIATFLHSALMKEKLDKLRDDIHPIRNHKQRNRGNVLNQ